MRPKYDARDPHYRGPREVTVNDAPALAAIEAVLPGKVLRVTATRAVDGTLGPRTIIPHRPLTDADKASILTIVPGADISV